MTLADEASDAAAKLVQGSSGTLKLQAYQDAGSANFAATIRINRIGRLT